MCGFVGLYKKNGLEETDINKVRLVSNQLSRRGPDQSGEWVNGDNTLILSHKRLSINDLSKEGIQPMKSKCNRYIIVYNGEIYNFRSLKEELHKKNHQFNGNSDTEVILSLIEEFGFEETLKKLNGMFSLALFDQRNKNIYLSRDQSGQKPLYFFYENDIFYFTSEIRSLKKIKNNNLISKKALKLFFQLSYIPSPYSIYHNVFKLKKGNYLIFDTKNNSIKYQEILKNKIINSKLNLDNNKKLEQFDSLFSDVIKDHLISDVKNGTLLSGGVDSTIVTYYSNLVSNKKIDSFCVKSNDKNYDESHFAEDIAKKIGTNHHTLEFSQSDLFDAIANIHRVYDEPFGDSSQIPTYLLFKSIKNSIKVALSGDGGDEIFYGYNRYIFLNQYYKFLKKINPNLRKLLSKSLRLVSETGYDKINSLLNLNQINFGNKIYKISQALNFKNIEDFYFQLIRQDYSFDNIVKLDQNTNTSFCEKINFSENKSDLQNFQNYDMDYYLTDDIFVKVDRASMFNSIESRAPFVDKRVIEFSMNLQDEEKIDNKTSKLFLKKLLMKKINIGYKDRPKMGFGNPIGKWLKNELNQWAGDIINSDNDNIKKIINIEFIKSLWVQHNLGKGDYSNILWNFIMFKNWYNLNEID